MPEGLEIRDAVIQRALEQMRQPYAETQQAQPRELNPTLLAMLGSVADGASTYRTMKRGNREDNAALQGMSPTGTALSAMGSGLLGAGVSHLIGQKWPKVGRALAGNLGAHQIGIAANNLGPLGPGQSSIHTYHDAVMRALRENK
jgi:hypothetical protein